MDGIGIDDKGWYGIGQLDDMELLCDDLEQVSWESWYMGLILFQGKEQKEETRFKVLQI